MESLVVQATRIDYGRIHLQTIFEEEEPSTSPVVDKKQVTRTTKVSTLFLRCIQLKPNFFYHIPSNMSWSSFSLSDASCFLRGILPLFNLPLTKHLCITRDKKKVSAIFYEYLSLMYYIKVRTIFTYPPLPWSWVWRRRYLGEPCV